MPKKTRTGLRAAGTTTYRPDLEPGDTDDARLLAEAMTKSRHPATGLRLTQAEFATLLDVNPRTLRRKLAGLNDLKERERAQCRAVIAAHDTP